ncbi:MAG: hypothetical protein ACOC6I_03230 [Candidatus Bipolaricaulota bacterium]
MANSQKPFTLGRPIDLNYPGNAFILGFSFASFIGYGLATYFGGVSVLNSLAFGARSFLSVFLAWALGREVDPDRPTTAGLAAVGQVIVIWFIDVPSLLLSFWALFTLRILNRTTGLKAGILDTVLVTGISAWLGYQLSWVIAGTGAVVFLADGIMESPNRKHLVPGVLLFGEAIYLLATEPYIWRDFFNYPVKFGLILAISFVFLSVIYANKTVNSVADETGERLSVRRVQLAQLVAVMVALLFPLWAGVHGFHQSATFWSVLGGSSLVHVARTLALFMG